MITALLSRIPALLYVVLALLALCGWQHYQLVSIESATRLEAVQRSEAARETERIANHANSKIFENLAIAQTARDNYSRASSNRLRDLAAKARADSPTVSACSNLSVETVAVISDPARERLERIADYADETAEQLMACQDYLIKVVKPSTCGWK